MKKIVFALLLMVVIAVPAFSQMNDMPMKGHGEGHGQDDGNGQYGYDGRDMMCMEQAIRWGSPMIR